MDFPLIAVPSVRRGSTGAEPARMKAALKERQRAGGRFDHQPTP
jgi:hypothetical protein